MGPYSEQKQLQRAESLTALLRNPDLPEDTRRIWENHLANLSRNEATYNYRVREVYSKLSRKGIIEYE